MATLDSIMIYPVKSCSGIPVQQCRVTEFGLELDRHWMIIHPNGRFLSQREFPSLACVNIQMDRKVLALDAPGMTTLVLPMLEPSSVSRMEVTVWADSFPAYIVSEKANRWFSSYLGTSAKLVRYDETVRREVNRRWTGHFYSVTQFADGFPFLITGQSSLDELNNRLTLKGAPPLPMNRFRPNLTLSGFVAFEEDRIESLSVGQFPEDIEFKLVKKCARCTIPTIDQSTGTRDKNWPSEPLSTLAEYRFDAEVNGLTFGQNAIAIKGAGKFIAVGQDVRIVSYR